MSIAPQWLQIVSNFNPFKHIVEALRAVFLGDFSNPIVWIGLLLAIVLVVVGSWLGARTLAAQTK
jgi:ABC-2 type transport system permease protein